MTLNRYNVTVSLRRKGNQPVEFTFRGIFAESQSKAMRAAEMMAHQPIKVGNVAFTIPSSFTVIATDCMNTNPVLSF